MTNEQIVSEIRNGYSVTDYMQLLYESNLPLIKKFIKPYVAYEPMELCGRYDTSLARHCADSVGWYTFILLKSVLFLALKKSLRKNTDI